MGGAQRQVQLNDYCDVTIGPAGGWLGRFFLRVNNIIFLTAVLIVLIMPGGRGCE